MALRQAIDQLAALGRNFNQIARVLNQGGRAQLPGTRELTGMLEIAEALKDDFRALLDANHRSWEEGRAHTTH